MAIKLTDAAIARLTEVRRMRQAPGEVLRVGVRSGGCSGLTYYLDFVPAPEPKDRVFDFPQGIRVVVDAKSYLFMNGTEVDFVTDGMMSSNFEFRNPLARTTCACGDSFKV
jgi:iron-sulfur cluster assembly protein